MLKTQFIVSRKDWIILLLLSSFLPVCYVSAQDSGIFRGVDITNSLSTGIVPVAYQGSEILWKYPREAIRFARAKQTEYDYNSTLTNTDDDTMKTDDEVNVRIKKRYFGFFVRVVDASISRSDYLTAPYVVEQKPLLYYRGDRTVDIPLHWPLDDDDTAQNKYRIVLFNSLTTLVASVDIVLAVSPVFEVKANPTILTTDKSSYNSIDDTIIIKKQSSVGTSFRGTDVIRIIPAHVSPSQYYTTPLAIYDNVLGRFPDDDVVIGMSELSLSTSRTTVSRNSEPQYYKAVLFLFGKRSLMAGESNVFTILSKPRVDTIDRSLDL